VSFADRVYRVEQRFVAVAMGVMGVVVFFDVIHRVASRDMSLLASILSGVAAVIVCAAAIRMRHRAAPQPAATTWIKGALAAGVLWAGLRIFLYVLPNGLVWSQTVGLVLTLWVGIIGASMAARQHRHLALDLGSKLWPKKALPYVQAGGNFLTATFCLVLAALAVVSLRDHFRDYADTDGAGGIFPAVAIPKWIAFFGLPIGFVLMAIRFYAQVMDGFRGKVEEDDALRMLGLEIESKVDGPAK
jgi:C4-dicarboxylate transporter, DctQ subunit